MNIPHIPQITGWLKPLAVVAIVALWTPLNEAYRSGALTNFDMMVDIIKHNAFGAFFDVLKVAVGWILLEAPTKPKE